MKLTKFQIDYVKLKMVDYRGDINFGNLIPHPMLNNHYMLNPKLSENAKNFSLYIRGNCDIIMKFSIPYLLRGHNYTSVGSQELIEVKNKIKKWLDIDITLSVVMEFEFGMYETIDCDSEKYISRIKGINNYDLKKATHNFKMYGDSKRKVYYKIYDAVANAKSKKTYTKGGYPKGNLIKHELKFSKPNKYFDFSLMFFGFYHYESYIRDFKTALLNSRKNLIFEAELEFTPVKSSLISILYTALKNMESGVRNDNVVKLLESIIDETNLSASQKSKRKKSIALLENQYNNQV